MSLLFCTPHFAVLFRYAVQKDPASYFAYIDAFLDKKIVTMPSISIFIGQI